MNVYVVDTGAFNVDDRVNDVDVEAGGRANVAGVEGRGKVIEVNGTVNGDVINGRAYVVADKSRGWFVDADGWVNVVDVIGSDVEVDAP